MVLEKSVKLIGLVAVCSLLAACSTTGKKLTSNQGNVLPAKCIAVVPLAVDETDLSVLKVSREICQDDKNADLWVQLAQQFFTLEQYGKAVQAANIALKLKPDNAVAKDIVFRAGLKITGSGLDQIRDSSQFLYGDSLKDANQLVTQINKSVGERALEPIKISHKSSEFKTSYKKTPKNYSVKKVQPRKVFVKKTVSTPVKQAVKPAVKPAAAPVAAPKNPFSSFQ